MNGFYKFAVGLMRFVMPLWYKIETEGLENLPEEGGYLFVSNHRSNADPILIGIQNPDIQFCFLAKQELFSDGLVGWLLRKLGAVAVDRGAGDVTALEEIEFRLQNGQNALIFPEGTRSKDGKLGHFKTGAALIAAQTGVPVVPVAISFDDELHFRSTIRVRYGEVFDIPKTDAKDPSAAVLKQVRQAMTNNVAALLAEDDGKPSGQAALPDHGSAAAVHKTKETQRQKTQKAADSADNKNDSEVIEKTMSKNKNHNKNNQKQESEKKLEKTEKEIEETAEDAVEEAEEKIESAAKDAISDAEDAADRIDEAFSDADDADEDDGFDDDDFDDDEEFDDEDDDDVPVAVPFKLGNPFKKLLNKGGDDEELEDEDFDDDDDEADEDEDDDDLPEDAVSEDEFFGKKRAEKKHDEKMRDDEPTDDLNDEDLAEMQKELGGGLFGGGFSLKNPFKKKAKNSFDDDFDDALDDEEEDFDDEDDRIDYEDDEYDDDDDEAAVGGKRVDYGRIALILTFVILGIFAIDFFKRLWNDWQSQQGLLEIQNHASSTVDSMSGDSQTDVTPIATTEPPVSTTLPIETTVPLETEVTTVTTTTGKVDNRATQTVAVSNDLAKSGSLALIDAMHQQTAAPQLIAFSDIPYQHLRVVTTAMKVDSSLSAPIINWFNDFFAATGQGNIMVYSTVDTPGYPPYSTQIAERTTGLTLDLAILNEAAQSHSPYAPDGNYAWLSEHAADYGFIVRYPADKKEKTGMDGMSWHFRYVGAPHAKYMAENNLCLEEYLELLQDHPWDSEHLTATVGGVEYEMYYVPVSATGATTDVKYPVSATGATPIISGDNNGGFVVAVVKE